MALPAVLNTVLDKCEFTLVYDNCTPHSLHPKNGYKPNLDFSSIFGPYLPCLTGPTVQVCPSSRLGVDSILQHPWFHDLPQPQLQDLPRDLTIPARDLPDPARGLADPARDLPNLPVDLSDLPRDSQPRQSPPPLVSSQLSVTDL